MTPLQQLVRDIREIRNRYPDVSSEDAMTQEEEIRRFNRYFKDRASHHGGLAIRLQNEMTVPELDALSASIKDLWKFNQEIRGVEIHRAIDYRILPGDPRTDDFRAVYDPLPDQ